MSKKMAEKCKKKSFRYMISESGNSKSGVQMNFKKNSK